MANKLKESAKNILGLNSNGPLLQRTDYENLISLSDATKEDHELAMKNIELKRILIAVMNTVFELSTIALIQIVASGDQDLQRTFAGSIFGLIITSALARSTLANLQYRKAGTAIQRFFAELKETELSESFTHNEIGQIQTEISAMASAELQAGNLPMERLIWLSLKLILIAYNFPNLTPVIVAQWIASILQIYVNTKAFSKLESSFRNLVNAHTRAITVNKDVTRKERRKEAIANINVTIISQIINTITHSSALPFIYALTTAESPITLITTSLLSALNIVGGEIKQSMWITMGAHIQFTHAQIGRNRLNNLINELRVQQIQIITPDDRNNRKLRLADEPQIKDTLTNNQLPPPGFPALLFSHLTIPHPTTKEPLINDLTGFLAMPPNTVTVLTGTSGSGKSLLAKSILQNYTLATGRSGKQEPSGDIIDFRDDIKTPSRKEDLYLNVDELSKNVFWADLFPYNLQIALLATNNYDVQDDSIIEFLRSNWGQKIKNASQDKKLLQIFNLIKNHLIKKLKETGLFVETEDFENLLEQEISKYSQGQQQRLCIASVDLNPNVRLVIFDEPLKALDTENRDKDIGNSSKMAVVNYLKKLSQRGVNVVIISHETAESLDTLFGNSLGCLIRLDNGQLIVDGKGSDLVNLKSTPLNEINGMPADEAGSEVVRDPEMVLPIYRVKENEISDLKQFLRIKKQQTTKVRIAFENMISKHTNEDQKKEDQNTINTYINILTALYNLIISKENENTVLINFDVFSKDDWKTFYFVMSNFLHYLYNSDYNDPQTENATVAGFPTLLKYLKIFEKICMAITPEAKKIRVYWMDFEDEPTLQQRTNSVKLYNIQETLYALIENYTKDDLKSLIEDNNGQNIEDARLFVDYIKQQK